MTTIFVFGQLSHFGFRKATKIEFPTHAAEQHEIWVIEDVGPDGSFVPPTDPQVPPGDGRSVFVCLHNSTHHAWIDQKNWLVENGYKIAFDKEFSHGAPTGNKIRSAIADGQKFQELIKELHGESLLCSVDEAAALATLELLNPELASNFTEHFDSRLRKIKTAWQLSDKFVTSKAADILSVLVTQAPRAAAKNAENK